MNRIAVGISQLIQTVHESFTEMYNSFIMAPKFSLQSISCQICFHFNSMSVISLFEPGEQD